MSNKQESKTCFILGIEQRSGTNFLWRLLLHHPNIVSPGPIWEDHLLRNAHILEEYSTYLYNSWNEPWNVPKEIGEKRVLLKHIGKGLENFLHLQVSNHSAGQTLLLSKTPSVHNLNFFCDFFPNSKLILLVRDGRSVVESGAKSFGWSYENGFRRWSSSAKTILEFMNNESNHGKYILVRYEDLLNDQKNQIQRILNYLSLDSSDYDFEEAKKTGITGSSQIKNASGKVHWNEVKPDSEFKPLKRFEHWNKKRHKQFNWIAGNQMKMFGYELSESYKLSAFFKVYYGIKDVYFKKLGMSNAYFSLAKRAVKKVNREIDTIFKS